MPNNSNPTYVHSMDLFGSHIKQIPCIVGEGSPTESTAGAVGMLYMDASSDNGEMYKCIKVSDTSYTWVKLVSEDNGENVALTADQINALDGMFKVAAYDEDAEYTAAYAAFCTAFGLSDPDSGDTEETLSSISATYSGGSVPAGTAVTALTGVVVTAHYSDGSTANVTGYTLSGSIVEGENTITVTYQGKTTTFTVTGTAETGGEDSGGNDGDVSNEVKWTDGVAYSYEVVENEYVDTNGAFTAFNEWNRTPYLYCKDAAVLRVVVNAATSMMGTNNIYNAFYDDNKEFIEPFNYTGIDSTTAGAYKDVEIPANAAYFAASHKAGVIGSSTNGLSVVNAAGFVPYSEVPV